MIRFECETCGRSLRAPADLVGKRGRCARCGSINRVPSAAGRSPRRQTAIALDQPVNVEVKRALGTSPFRSTSDVELAEGALTATTFVAIEAAAPKTQFAAIDRPALLPALQSPAPAATVDFLDHLATKMGEPAEAAIANFDDDASDPLDSPAPARRRLALETLRLGSLPIRTHIREPRAHEEAPSAQSAIIAVLAAGMMIGFVIGVIFMKWVV